MDITTAVNFAVVLALVILALSMALLVYSLGPLLSQITSTALSFQKLSDTMEREVTPTLKELRNVMDGVNQIKSITAQRVQDVGNKAEELTGNVTTLVGTAKKESSVASAGLFAGLKAYLYPQRDEQKSESKAIRTDRERKNV